MGLKVNLPFSAWEYRLPGVYRIDFRDGSFYIGCSEHLRDRASSWIGMFKKRAPDITVGSKMIEKIMSDNEAELNIVELCAPEDIKDRELFYLSENRDNPKMLSHAECGWKPVLQYTKDGTFVKKHLSTQGAARYNKTTIWRIQEVLHGDRKSHKEMVFVYEKDYAERRKEIISRRAKLVLLPKKTKGLKLQQYTIDGTYVETYITYVEAAKKVNCHPGGIKTALAGVQKTAGGFIWKYAE